jgi:DNA-binding transcriptional LysR family regulator
MSGKAPRESSTPNLRWSALDLNLLVLFDAVLQERSVTRAGNRMGLSQPAMSPALNRLHLMLRDELFIRTPDGMMPTPRAEQLAGPVRNALNEMRLALEQNAFIPATAERCFVIEVTLDIVNQRAELDLALGRFGSPGERFRSTAVLEDTFAVVMRRGHPAGRKPPSAASLAGLSHLDISSAGEYAGSSTGGSPSTG